MHRWFIAIFALHFLVSVSAFSLGSTAPSAPAVVVLGALPAAASAAESPSGRTATALPQEGAPHTLLDELPDLPDSLPRSLATARPAFSPASERPWTAALPPSRVPETPLRPPRGPHA
ncbi:MAG: hypothetical protein ACK40L_06080 [Hydrogenophaga sp.]